METKISPDEWIKIKKAYENGKTCTKLSEEYEVSITRISTKLRGMGTIIRPFFFQKGNNTWAKLTKKETEQRKKEFSIRMSKYNPMKRREVAAGVALKLKEKIGPKNSNYKHGRRSFGVRGLTFKKKLQFLNDSGNECKVCEETEPLTVHHIDGDKGNCEKKNLIVLCANCHYKIHWGTKKLNKKISQLRKKLLLKEVIRRRYENGERKYKEFI